ncbi:MAG: ABC transporter substrate-binding protein, partial [Chloroflexota bacterium]
MPPKLFSFISKVRMVLALWLLALLVAGCGGENPTPTPTIAPRTGAPNLAKSTSTPANKFTPAVTGSTTTTSILPTVTNIPAPTIVPTNTPAPTPTPMPPASKGGNVTGALLYDPLNLHPYKRNNESGLQLTQLLYAGALTSRDPNSLALIPGAATSWTVNVAALTVTFKLKEGLRWSDGLPLTSSDYLWTYEQLRKPENSWPYATNAFYNPANPNSTGIENLTAPDARTLVVKLHTLSYDLAARADVIEPLPRQTWESKDWNDPTKNPEINRPSVVSGPWKLQEWKLGEKITFVANGNSTIFTWPNLDSLTFQIVPDSATALQRLKNGELDFYTPEASEQAEFEKLSNVQTYRWTPLRPTWQYVGFNFRKPSLQDRLLRQVLAYATDRKTIIDKLAFGLGRPLYSDVAPWQPYFVPNLPRYDFNPNLAQRLLKEVGYTLKDDKLVSPNGTPLPTLKLVYNSPSPLREGIANLLKQSYGTLGIQLQVIALDSSSYVKFITNPASDYDLFLGGWTTDLDPEQFGEVWQKIPELNNGAYGNEKLTNLYEQVQKEVDSVKRKDLMAQIQRLEAEEQPYIYLYAQLDWLNVSKRVAGFTTNSIGPAGNLYTDWFVV